MTSVSFLWGKYYNDRFFDQNKALIDLSKNINIYLMVIKNKLTKHG